MPLTVDDFNRITDRTPHIVDLRPGGTYVMADLDRVGGVPRVLKVLLDAGLLHGDAMTVTGKTMKENLRDVPAGDEQKVIRSISQPINKTGTIRILKGNLAPEGAVVKVAGVKNLRLEGPARVFASTGFFSRGIWFAGGGVSVQATPKVGASLSFTRSWSNDSATGVAADRRELSGAASYLVKPQVAVFGALGRTIGTTDESGAGTTVSGGVSVLFNARGTK